MNTMAAEWIDFVGRDMAPNAPIVQVMEMRKAFYAGLASGVKLGLERTPEQNLAEMKEYIEAEDSRRRMARITQLMHVDPHPESKAGVELIKLVTEQEIYEKRFGFQASDAGEQG